MLHVRVWQRLESGDTRHFEVALPPAVLATKTAETIVHAVQTRLGEAGLHVTSRRGRARLSTLILNSDSARSMFRTASHFSALCQRVPGLDYLH
eukprot:8453661-Alexandrium_andersonii.AAC.1